MTRLDHRTRLRAALQIHERLTRSPPAMVIPRLPVEAWQDLVTAQHRLELAEERGWKAAAKAAQQDYRRLAVAFSERLSAGVDFAPEDRPSRVQSPREILADLAALEREFPEVAIDLKERSLGLTTDPIVLEEIDLGRFRILLHWDELPDAGAYDIIAVDPHPATADEATTHPHVREERLCEGEGRIPIRRALEQGRLFDFGVLVRQVLETYNPGSAYHPLSRWSGVSCSDCGYVASDDDSTSCDRCSSDLCCDCSSSCGECGLSCCSDCRNRCAVCEESHCTVCLGSCRDCGENCCRTCLEQGCCELCRDVDEADAIETTEITEATVTAS